MTQAIEAYHKVVVSDEFRELERLREKARFDEAAILGAISRENQQIGEQRGITIGEQRGIAIGEQNINDKIFNKMVGLNDDDPLKAVLQSLLSQSE